ncbi:Ada metal-binding domain-containing protein [Planctobacterium marinum]|uniref:3-methyladenine DNA glycosylase n=1 Tax=Planctobacterium marinum TaxID=1631968 RepID=A0AA48KWK0_9ALTE|nr:3-methyladenine DNA glycosylase [Planctobacterium marinum]
MNYQTWQQARLSRDRRFDGRFFVAVKTTGIFCRNICPANLPKEENVEYYAHAAQALDHGYRPCLRCRPDSAPSSYAWLGVETTVVRAMKLLRDNPESGLDSIAQRLGISDGYLRKLFRQHLGVSPKQYQLTEQLLFAKKLLHETSLSVEQVALTAGFQSARRLQQNLKDTLQLTPTQIRQQQSQEGKQLQLYLSYTPDYCWRQVRDFWQVRAVPGMETVTDDSYARSFSWQDDKGYLSAEIEPERFRFKVTLSLQNYQSLRFVLQNIKRVLDLETDYSIVKEGLLQTGLTTEQLTPGIRIPGVWSLFEAGCRAILGQQVSVKAAVNKVAQLTEELGEPLPGEQQLTRLFPTPEAVAKSELAFLKMPEARKRALRALAQYLHDNPEDNSPDAWLEIKGIGPWTVAYAKMRGLSEPDIWLGTDLVIKKQIEQFSLQTDAAAPWRSYLTFQLWDHA